MLIEAGAEHDIRLFGGHALNSLRLEKSFGSWAREFRPIYGPMEAGLDRFVSLEKNTFVGRDAAMAERDAGPERRLVTLAVDAADADAIGDEPIWHDGKVVGWVTSGGYGHVSGTSIALGYVPAGLAGVTDRNAFEVEIIGDRRPATLLAEPLIDPIGSRMRS
jgi:dimethylglycine dehydrogenase